MLALTLDPQTREVLVWVLFIVAVVLMVNAVYRNFRNRR
jgi:hypothetical protein